MQKFILMEIADSGLSGATSWRVIQQVGWAAGWAWTRRLSLVRAHPSKTQGTHGLVKLAPGALFVFD
ncbi:hypothetical protein [Rhodohalobacter sp.]|uniref:hypothetical protein n=1 Tax=Rhodohalobacter sp. TaxID=1974210 RepID=UPI002ACD46FC|nr:hypothetical protein [Rhodohalobacter sp.]MDZ7757144.1 hypothetical protein [Rhodohalobacter sp.]